MSLSNTEAVMGTDIGILKLLADPAKQATIDALAEAAEDQHDAAQTELKRLKDIAERLRAVASEV